MLKQLKRPELERLLATVAQDYALQVPQQLSDGTRQLAPYGTAELSLSGEQLQTKPTACFFPQTELLLTITDDGQVLLPANIAKPQALFGLNRVDLAALAFLDRFFSAPPADDVYLRRRNGALLLGLTGFAGADGAFLPLTDGNCDLELIADNGCWLALGHSAHGRQLLAPFAAGEQERLAELQHLSAEQSIDLSPLRQAAQLLAADRVPDAFWQEVADRCILCCGCNFSCPTCSCFGVQDRCSEQGTERSRVWDSCQLDAFMREASGHNPLGTEALRTRRRIFHKLVADVERWGELGCVACGRCDRACPSGIGMFAVVEEIVKRFA